MSPPLNLLFPCLWILCLFLFNPTAARTTPPPRRQDQIRQYLEPHNRERSKLGIPPLKWSKKLADFAASWAHTRQGDCELIHSGTNYGENLFWGSGKQWSHGDAVAAWAAERCYYDHAANSCRKGQDCLHYTQMVWRQSSRVGCARVVCKSGDTFVGCNYDPPGNVVGEKPF